MKEIQNGTFDYIHSRRMAGDGRTETDDDRLAATPAGHLPCSLERLFIARFRTFAETNTSIFINHQRAVATIARSTLSLVRILASMHPR